jgi:hypothetical protein
MAHYFLSVHEPRMASFLLLLGRQVLAIPLFVLLPRWLGFYGIYLVGPCADLLFAAVARHDVMVRELAKLRMRSPSHQATFMSSHLVFYSQSSARRTRYCWNSIRFGDSEAFFFLWSTRQ